MAFIPFVNSLSTCVQESETVGVGQRTFYYFSSARNKVVICGVGSTSTLQAVHTSSNSWQTATLTANRKTRCEKTQGEQAKI